MKSGQINRFQGSLRNLKYRLRRFETELTTKHLPSIIRGQEKRIVTMIRWQMWKGKNGAEMSGAYGDTIRPFYKPKTVKAKMRKGLPYDRVTLYDTGNFYRRIKISYNARYGFFIKSTDPKNDKLVEKYGANIFRLNRTNFNNLIDVVKKELQDITKKEILGE